MIKFKFSETYLNNNVNLYICATNELDEIIITINNQTDVYVLSSQKKH